jgi:HAD superfamily hydrolase (TIGR01509 family)
MPSRALLLDFNGTLVDDEALTAALYVDLFEAQGLAFTVEEYLADYLGLTDEEIVTRRFERAGRADGATQIIAEKTRRYCAAPPSLAPADVAALRRLGRTYALAIVSSAFAAEIEATLARAGILELFTLVVARESVAAAKPDPAPYRAAVVGLGVDSSAATAFEDSLVGLRAAAAAGVTAVGIATTLSVDELRLHVDLAFPRLADALRHIEARG